MAKSGSSAPPSFLKFTSWVSFVSSCVADKDSTLFFLFRSTLSACRNPNELKTLCSAVAVAGQLPMSDRLASPISKMVQNAADSRSLDGRTIFLGHIRYVSGPNSYNLVFLQPELDELHNHKRYTCKRQLARVSVSIGCSIGWTRK